MRKIAILGGGVGAMTTAVELTNDPSWKEQYDITVYQMGWRIGGKGASGRNADYCDRIEEHGLHMWGGFYENAFRLMRGAYNELHQKQLAPKSPFQSVEDAFQPANFMPVMDPVNGQWKVWPILFPENAERPGMDNVLGQTYPSPWACFGMLLNGVMEYVERSVDPDPEGSHSQRLHWLVNVILQAAEDAVCLIKGRHPFLLATIDAIQAVFELMVGSPVGQMLGHADDDLRRLGMVIDTGLAVLRGMAEDDVICQGFERINQWDFAEWLARNGAQMPINPITLAMYDACFAYPEGATTGPNLEAGTFLHAAMRLVFTYKGAIFWRMMAGMGDTIFSPIYLVLKNRGVTFRFFHKVKQLHLTPDGKNIGSIDLDVQATLKNAKYDPLVYVKDLPCWPSVPNYDQLVEGDRLKGTTKEYPFRNERYKNTNLESWWTDFPAVGKVKLQLGEDFDEVVLGISLGALRFICQELVDADPKWAAMIANVRSARTQALQLWMNKTAAQMGWNPGSCFTCPPGVTAAPVLGGYHEPFDTWSDMSELIPRENFPAGAVTQIAYFCNTAPDDPKTPGFDDPEYPERVTNAEVGVSAAFLDEYGAPIWPKARDPKDPSKFDSSVLVGGMQGQFVRVNVDPNELYVQSVADTGKYRIAPGDTGFDNLVIAGDWTENELNIGCVEAGVISGMMASRKLCGKPERYYGEGGDKKTRAAAGD
jgi:uncharacterized protein with NAD-binding domain and iron-sulfur cluster